MKKFICILFSCWAFCFCVSASDLDSNEIYSFEPVEVSSSLDPMTSSALDYGVSLASATSWDTADQANLAAIRNALTFSSSISGGSILYNLIQIRTAVTDQTDSGYLEDIRDAFYLYKSGNDGSIVASVQDITTIRDALLGASGSLSQPATHSIFSYIYNLGELPQIKSDTQYIEENTRSILGDTENIDTGVTSLLNKFNSIYPVYLGEYRNGVLSNFFNWGGAFGFFEHIARISATLWYPAVDAYYSYPTLYSLQLESRDNISKLRKVLASDDDILLAESQKANREEIESSFMTGSSGSTSLGASDFGDLADVGGTVKGVLTLDGNASIGSFTSGLGAADSFGQSWFSEATRAELDAVSSVSTYSLRGDPDPYNMSGWEDRYYWLIGDDVND